TCAGDGGFDFAGIDSVLSRGEGEGTGDRSVISVGRDLSLNMKSAVPVRMFSAFSDRVNSREYCHCLLAATFCAEVSLMSCGTPQAGPKLIEADGVRYTACGGAV